MTCAECRRMLENSREEDISLLEHLESCASCNEFLAAEDAEFIRNYVPSSPRARKLRETPPDDLDPDDRDARRFLRRGDQQ